MATASRMESEVAETIDPSGIAILTDADVRAWVARDGGALDAPARVAARAPVPTVPVAQLVEEPSGRRPGPQPLAPPPPAPLVGQTAVTPVVTRLRALLRDRVTLQAAFVLHEVLGPPKCRRRNVGV